ncbi:cell division protein FtsQ/DivIB [Telmatobacter bradus]|uniref:cell division protein FtsQ/DivIB n=1 Tax=Telmatobacter bradus TaxID=474953 RepID=UPI003B430872
MNLGSTTNRPPTWEDEQPTEPPVRRKAQARARVSPRLSQADGASPEDEAGAVVRPEWGKRWTGSRDGDAPQRPWWRPQSNWGRALLALGALTVLGGLTAGGLALRTYLEHANGFRIAGTSNIQATGLTEASRADLLPVFGEDIGKNIFFVHLDERKRELEQIPWIEHATVMRVLPDQLRVTVVERKPVAFTQIGQQTGLVDGDGVLLTMSAADMAGHHYSFPVVTGLNPGDSADARRQRMAVYVRMIAELDANNQHNSEQLSEVDLSNPENARVKLIEQGSDVTAELGEDHFMERFQRYKAHISEWRQQYPQLAGVDLRYDDQMVLKMGSAATNPPPPTDAAASAAVPSAKPSQQSAAPVAANKAAKSAEKNKTSDKNVTKENAKGAANSKDAKNHAGTAKAGVKDAKNSTTTARKTDAGKQKVSAASAAAHGNKAHPAVAEGKNNPRQAHTTQTDKARVEQLRLEQQKKHDAAQHHAALSADKNHPAVSNTVGLAVEGQ